MTPSFKEPATCLTCSEFGVTYHPNGAMNLLPIINNRTSNQLKIMDPLKRRRLLVVLILGQTVAFICSAAGGCGFPAVYNFGDSNSDTGGVSAAMKGIQPPNGETFFGHPAGRLCDGRLIVDFIAEKLKLPYLSTYLDSLSTNFRHGANFATAGSSIRPGGYSPFHLGIQVSQFIQFKSRTTDLYNRLRSNNRTPLPIKRSIARPWEFPKALYMFDIGQNDFGYGYQHTSEEQVRASIPDILSTFSEAVQQLYKEGARDFWVHNTGPIGCLHYPILYNSSPHDRDSNGCVKSQNKVAQEFNWQLKNLLLKLGKKLPLVRITLVDMYSAKYLLISNAKSLGFVNNPSRHITWDGIHYSEAANLWIANHIMNGSFSDPPLSIDKACQAPNNA